MVACRTTSAQQGEPRLDLSWRTAWVAGAVVLALVAVFAVAVWVLGSPGGSPTGGPGPRRRRRHRADVERTDRHSHPHHGHHRMRDPLQPVKIHRDPGCPIRPPQIIRVMQFNIHAGVSRYGGVGLARIAEEIRAAHPDIVSLNEVDSGTIRSGRADEAAYLGRATGLRAVYGPNLFGYDGGRFGNAILSRYPIQRDAQHPATATSALGAARAARGDAARRPPDRVVLLGPPQPGRTRRARSGCARPRPSPG